MNINKKKSHAYYCFVTILLIIINFICAVAKLHVYSNTVVASITLLIGAIIYFHVYSGFENEYQNRKALLLKIIYISFLLFGSGHFFVIALGGFKDPLMYIWNTNRFSDDIYRKTIFYTTCSILFYEIGSFIALKNFYSNPPKLKVHLVSPMKINDIINILFILAFVISIFLMSLYASIGNYSSIYKKDYGRYYNYAVMGSLLCIPLYLLIQYGSQKLWKILSNICMIFLILITIAIGKRTNAVMFFLPIVITNCRVYKNIKPRILILGGACLYIAATLLYTVSVTRVSEMSFGSELKLFWENLISFQSVKFLIIEIGSSVRNMMEIFKIYEMNMESYKYGMTYIYSIFIIVPGSIRGSFDKIATDNHWTGLASYITQTSGASYGLGGSAQMEAYMNFAIYGVFFFLALGYIITDLLGRQRFQDVKLDLFYKIAITTFIIILPRTTMQDNIKKVFYCCSIPFYIYVWSNRKCNIKRRL